MTDAGDLAELLGVEVDQISRPLTLIAHDRWVRIEALEATETEATQDAADARERQAEAAGDCGRGQPSTAERCDGGDLLGRPRQPLAHGALTDAEIGGDPPCWLLLIEHASDHQASTTRRRARILVQVLSGAPARALMAGNHQSPGPLRMNNLHSIHS